MNQWMKIAYDEAVKGMLVNDGGPFGAVVIQGDKVIAAAHNEVLKTNDPTAHSEINVIRKASEQLTRYDLSDCVLYTTSKPCPMCLGAIFWARIGTVYYGTTEHDAARGGFDDHRFYEMMRGENNDIVFKQIDYEANAKLFDQWLEKEDRQIY
ncbi:MAG: nucleoside deaminase [Campylobacterota bacterium]|nr:nucleoside deaminase [Campylobacterota bacterium]